MRAVMEQDVENVLAHAPYTHYGEANALLWTVSALFNMAENRNQTCHSLRL